VTNGSHLLTPSRPEKKKGKGGREGQRVTPVFSMGVSESKKEGRGVWKAGASSNPCCILILIDDGCMGEGGKERGVGDPGYVRPSSKINSWEEERGEEMINVDRGRLRSRPARTAEKRGEKKGREEGASLPPPLRKKGGSTVTVSPAPYHQELVGVVQERKRKEKEKAGSASMYFSKVP